jgi:hypothetical protein
MHHFATFPSLFSPHFNIFFSPAMVPISLSLLLALLALACVHGSTSTLWGIAMASNEEGVEVDACTVDLSANHFDTFPSLFLLILIPFSSPAMAPISLSLLLAFLALACVHGSTSTLWGIAMASNEEGVEVDACTVDLSTGDVKPVIQTIRYLSSAATYDGCSTLDQKNQVTKRR